MVYSLTLDGFQKQKRHDGIYVFYSPNCFTCEFHIEKFSKQFPTFYAISTSEDIEYFDSIGIKITPTTRIYKSGNLVWEKDGMLFDEQLEEMRKYL